MRKAVLQVNEYAAHAMSLCWRALCKHRNDTVCSAYGGWRSTRAHVADAAHITFEILSSQSVFMVCLASCPEDCPVSTCIMRLGMACRWKFTMARARTNWKRLQSARATLGKYSAAFDGLQSWEHPEQSLAAIACTTLLSFYPHVMLAAFFLFLMFRSLLHYRSAPLLVQALHSTT